MDANLLTVLTVFAALFGALHSALLAAQLVFPKGTRVGDWLRVATSGTPAVAPVAAAPRLSTPPSGTVVSTSEAK